MTVGQLVEKLQDGVKVVTTGFNDYPRYLPQDIADKDVEWFAPDGMFHLIVKTKED